MEFSHGSPGSGIGRYRDQPAVGTTRGTVLLLHGWGGTSELNWSHSYGALVSAGWRVIAPDLPGHGRGARDTSFTLEGAADAAAGLLQATGAGDVIVAGYSLGGAVALLVARRHPDVVAGLVLSGSQASWPSLPPAWLLRLAGRTAAAIPGPVLRRGGRSILGVDPERNAWIRGEVSLSSVNHVAQAAAALRGFDATPWLRQLRLPTVVLVSTRDTFVLPSRQRALAAAIPGAITLDVDMDHSDPPSRPGDFPRQLLRAVEACRELDPRHSGAPGNS